MVNSSFQKFEKQCYEAVDVLMQTNGTEGCAAKLNTILLLDSVFQQQESKPDCRHCRCHSHIMYGIDDFM